MLRFKFQSRMLDLGELHLYDLHKATKVLYIDERDRKLCVMKPDHPGKCLFAPELELTGPTMRHVQLKIMDVLITLASLATQNGKLLVFHRGSMVLGTEKGLLAIMRSSIVYVEPFTLPLPEMAQLDKDRDPYFHLFDEATLEEMVNLEMDLNVKAVMEL